MITFHCKAQGFRGTKRERAHLGTDAWVRPCGFACRAAQQTEQVFAKVVPHKAIHYGVDAAVEVGNADGEGHGSVNDFQHGAVLLQY